MRGAMIGDVVGSRFEWHNHLSKDFDLYSDNCFATDDSVMTLAVAKALFVPDDSEQAFSTGSFKPVRDPQTCAVAAANAMRDFYRKYGDVGYGGKFRHWLRDPGAGPYNSYGNGAAMRVSPCGWFTDDVEEALDMSDAVTGITHNHPEGLKGARAVVESILLFRQGRSADEVRAVLDEKYYDMSFNLNDVPSKFDVTCQGSVPPALKCALVATDFEDAIRNAVSIGGDTDTIAAIAGSVADARFGVGRGGLMRLVLWKMKDVGGSDRSEELFNLARWCCNVEEAVCRKDARK